MAKQKDDNNLAWFVAGLALGVAGAILFAPRSGQETRESLAKTAARGREFANRKRQEAEELGREVLEHGREAATETVRAGKEILEHGRQVAAEARAAGKEALDRGRQILDTMAPKTDEASESKAS